MSARERGDIWPVICVIAVTLVVLVLPLIIRHSQASARMATVDPQVTIGDSKTDASATRDSPMYRWPHSEVPRTAERLRDLTAVAIAASTYIGQAALFGHVPRDTGEITTEIAKRQLIPPEWLTSQPGVFQTSHGTLHLRYAPNVLTIEVVSMPSDSTDGPALLIRIPDDVNTTIGPRYFESMGVDAISYPNPFAPIAEVISSGWRERALRTDRLP